MHIVFVVGFFAEHAYANKAGMPAYVAKMSKLLTEKKHKVEIVAGSMDSKEWTYHGIKIYDCQWYGDLCANTLEISCSIIRRELAFQKKLREINQNDKIDIVQYAGWSGVGCLHSLKCPAVLRLSTYSKEQYKEFEGVSKYVQVYSFWERMAGRRAKGIIGPGKILLDKFCKDINKSGTIIETPFENDVVDNETLYQSKLLDKKYILFYGTASRDKGFDTITEMMPKLLDEFHDLYFVFAGWNVRKGHSSTIGILTEKLGAKKNRFINLSEQNHEELYPIIKRAELVLIPSIIDNLPNAGVEALSLKKIIIGTYNTSLEQLIEDGITGFLAKPGDADSLYRAVKRALILSEEEKRKMIDNTQKIAQLYSSELVVNKLVDYYRTMIKR